MNPNTLSNYNFISNYFDQTLYPSNILSMIALLIYFPIGSLLVLIRIILIVLLSLISRLKPDLTKNKKFIRLTCFCIGIHTSLKNNESKINNESSSQLSSSNTNIGGLTNKKTLISNHISCLDFCAIKCLFTKSGTTGSYSHSNRNLNSEMPTKSYLESLFYNFFHESRNETIEYYVHFPELMSTNGKYGLLKFDTKPFDTVQCVKPICLSVKRPGFPLAVNYMHSNNYTNIVFTLFAPVTIYELTSLKDESKIEHESGEQFAERIRALISAKLRFTQITDKSFTQFQQIWNQYQAAEEATAEASRQNTNRSNDMSDYSMSFSDISRLALQIKEILPDVSYETIQRHIRSSPSLDIDTVIASILDSTVEPQMPVAVAQPSPIRRNNSFKNYEERKFDLINEARKRYLARINNKVTN